MHIILQIFYTVFLLLNTVHATDLNQIIDSVTKTTTKKSINNRQKDVISTITINVNDIISDSEILSRLIIKNGESFNHYKLSLIFKKHDSMGFLTLLTMI